MARRVSDWVNHHIWRGGKIDKSVVIRQAYIKELLEPPQWKSLAARGFFKMPKTPPKQGQGSDK